MAALTAGAALVGADTPGPARAHIMINRDPLPSPDARPWTAPASVPDGVARLAAGLWRQLQGAGNLALSPCSLHACLAMVSAGARGETLAQMQHAVELPAPAALGTGWAGLAAALTPPAGPDGATAWSWTMAERALHPARLPHRAALRHRVPR